MRSEWDILPARQPRRVRALAVVVAGLLLPLLALTITGGSPTGEPVRVASPLADGAEDGAAAEAQLAVPGEDGDALAGEVATAQLPAAPASPPARSASAGDPPTPAGEPPKGDDVPDQWIVQLREGESAEAVAAEHEAEQDADVAAVYTAAISGYAADMSDEDAAEVAKDPRVASVVRDRLVFATAQTTPTGVARTQSLGIAGAVSGASAVDADIAILDTGIDAAHRDLNYRAGKNCTGSGAPTDGNGHGTHVAGTAAAKDDGNDVVGVAPGARVWAVKVLNNNGSGTWSQIICGLDWVAQNATTGATIEVANMSLGGGGSDSTCGGNDSLHNAICRVVNDAGVPIAVAAGNEGTNAAGSVPATYDEVITVSSLADLDGRPGALASNGCSDQDDTLSYFSNYGNDVDIIAPGSCIRSTRLGGGTTSMSGTSMATPHVAGAIADYMAKNGRTSPTAVKEALQDNGNLGWSGDRDSTREKLLNLGFLGGQWTVSDGGTTSTTTSTSTSSTTSSTTSTSTTIAGGGGTSITLTLTKRTYDSGTKDKVVVRWTGASGSEVDVYRNSTSGGPLSRIKTTSNDGGWTDKLGVKLSAGTTRTYRVCNAGTSTCSADATVTF